MSTTYTQILNRLRDQLREKGISATDLSEMVEKDISQVSRWLNGKVTMTIPTMLHICQCSEIEPAALFMEEATRKKRAA